MSSYPSSICATDGSAHRYVWVYICFATSLSSSPSSSALFHAFWPEIGRGLYPTDSHYFFFIAVSYSYSWPHASSPTSTLLVSPIHLGPNQSPLASTKHMTDTSIRQHLTILHPHNLPSQSSLPFHPTHNLLPQQPHLFPTFILAQIFHRQHCITYSRYEFIP